MSTESFDQLLADYIDGNLPPADLARVEKELARRPDLAGEIAVLRRIYPVLRSMPDAEVPASLTDNILSATTQRRRRRLRERTRRFPALYRPLQAAAAIAVVLVVSIALWSSMHATRAPLGEPEMILAKSDRAPADPYADDLRLAREQQAHTLDALAMLERRMREPAGSTRSATGSVGLVATGSDIRPAVSETRAVGGAVAARRGDGDALRDKYMAARVMKEKPAAAPPAPAEAETGFGVGSPVDRSADLPADYYRVGEPEAEEAAVALGAAAPADDGEKKSAELDADEAGETGDAGAGILRRWEGYNSGVTRRTARLITNDAQWIELWRLMNFNLLDKPALPEIDFGDQVVIAVFLGLRNTGGFSVRIQSVTRVGDAIHVLVRETTPQPGQLVPQALTQPYAAVVVPRTVDGLTITETTPIKIISQ